jgi:protein-tyrosine phosphatase
MTTATEIIPNLWIGNILNSSNKEFISKIDIVINCSKNIAFSSNKTKNLRVPIDDNLEKKEIVALYKYLDPITKFIHKNLLSGKKILVHCYAGKQRSASVICAYLIRYLKISYKEVSELMKSKRMIVFTPLPNFDGALKLFEKSL